MANTVFKYHHYHHQHPHNSPHSQQPHNGGGGGVGGSGNGNGNVGSNHNQNNSNQNSIFVLNAETKITPNSCSKYYLDFNDNSVDSSAPPSALNPVTCNGSTNGGGATSSSSVWSSASSTMCSPAAHAIQKLFNCSSGSSTSKHQGNYAGIDSKTFKTPKSELLKKKSKFWQYLEGEAGYEGIETPKENKSKSRKPKSKYWSKSYANDNQKSNHSDLSELLEYSCSLCDNCRCMDCQIGYFDCDNSDDSNSEYSFHMSGYEEDEDIEKGMELKTTIATATTTADTARTCSSPSDEAQAIVPTTFRHSKMDNKNAIQYLEYETPTRHAAAHRGGGGVDLAEVESCHQCYGLEVEQHCLDFHRLYSECGDRNH